MHLLARNFTSEVEKETLTEFDTTFHYKKVFQARWVIEEFIYGVFVKYINN